MGRRLSRVFLILLVAAAAGSARAAATVITECDRLAANPSDPGRTRAGVAFHAIDVERALDACERAAAAEPDEPRYRYQYARVLQRANQLADAMPEYRAAARQGYAAAAHALGLIFLERPVVPGHRSKAARWFRDAANDGHPGAQYLLGLMYLAGDGVKEDAETGLRWLKAAASQELARAKYLVGVAHDRGIGTDEDDANAAAWYRDAGAQGHRRAAQALWRLDPDDPTASPPFAANQIASPAPPVPEVTAVVETAEASGAGEEAALELVPEPPSADAPLDSGPVAEDVAGALAKGLEAYHGGDYGAAFAAWYPLAERGIRRAQFYIGGLFMDGRGTYADKVQAYYWLKRSQNQGYPPSQPLLDDLVAKMTPQEIERAERLVAAHSG